MCKEQNKGEPLILKASDDSYMQDLRAMRSNPDLKELGEDVQKVRRTLNGEMILELRKESKASNSF